jgi:hypothetical protein
LRIRYPHHYGTYEADSDPTFYFDADRDPDPAFHFDADPDPTFHFDPDPTFHFDADLDLYKIMRIRIRKTGCNYLPKY